MVEASEATLWLISGGASLLFLGWALVQLLLIRRRTGATATRRWFLVFVLAMVAFVLAGASGGSLGPWTVVLAGASFALAGLGFYEAAHTQRRALEAAKHGA